ncbi:MAG TPA: xanthine dehydrogenase [Myxococcales bacterium]|nr:xanthine dehydrogenase [Myxococcales bacterium]
MGETLRNIGTRARRVDALEKVTGRARYVDDLELVGMLHLKALTSAHAHAELLSIDTRAAESMPGVFAVVTGKDVPGENQIGVQIADQPLLASGKVRQMSDRIALVAADTAEHAEAAVRAIKVEYRPLPVITHTDEALAPGAVKIHENGNVMTKKQVIRGDVEQGFAAAAAIVEDVYEVNYQEHAYLEPNGCIAIPEPDGGVTIHASAQAPFYIQKAVARVLGVDYARVRVIQATTGGGFGGKEDYPSEPSACAAVLAMRTGRPVKFVYDRAQDLAWSTKRHRMKVTNKIGADGEGRITAAQVRIDCDAGGYTGLSAIVSERSNSTAFGPYRTPTARVDTYVVYTNNLFGGAYRGFGTPQTTFAMEAQMDELAARLGLSPAEIRRRNILGPGDETTTCQKLTESVPGIETFEAALARSGYEQKRREFEAFNQTSRWLKKGIGIGACMYGGGLHAGGQFLEGSGALVHLRPDGSVLVSIGGTELGQGAFTVAAQCAAETLGVALEHVRVTPSSTDFVTDSGPTVASRTTVMSGNAVIDAARQLKGRILEAACELYGVPADEIELREGQVLKRDGTRLGSLKELANTAFAVKKVNLSAQGWYAPPRKTWDNARGNGDAYSSYCFAMQVAEVEVDLRSGRTRVVRVTAAHDVGQVINRTLIEGQIEGGVVQGVGYALMEDLKLDQGRCLNPSFTDYLIPTTLDVPEVDIVLIEQPHSAGPFGAKGIGEPSLIPAAAAVANAVSEAVGYRFRRLPLTPERVLMSLEEAGKLR